MKNIFVLFFLIISITVSLAQTIKIKWSENGLKWSDFQGIPSNDVTYSSELYYFMELLPDKIKVNDTLIHLYRVVTYMDARQSWSKVQTPLSLLYHQTVFDIAKSCAQKMNATINNFEAHEIQQQFALKQNECNKIVHRFAEESHYGDNEQVVQEWYQRLKKERNSFVEPKIPPFNKKLFRMGMYVGVGFGTFTNTLNRHITEPFGIHYGFEFGYKKLMFGVHAGLYNNEIKSDFKVKNTWTKQDKTNMAIGDLYVGYVIFDNPRQKLYPHIGIGVVELSSTSDDPAAKKFVENGVSFVLGVTHDYKLRKTIHYTTSSFYNTTNEYVETFIKTRLSFSPVTYSSEIKGVAVNLCIGIGFAAHRIK